MLRNTFLHIPGIGPKTERRIWEAGIHTWEDFLDRSALLPMAEPTKKRLLKWAEESVAALAAGNADFFASLLPSREVWRTYPSFQQSAVFLDIETSGISSDFHEITCIGIYPAAEGEAQPKLFVKGFNLEMFPDEISDYRLIITYNGAAFDLPFIRAQLRRVKLPPLHLDLRYVLNRLGYRGGLKSIERQVGIPRGERIRDLDGFDAARLWGEYEQGSTESLKVMLEYNIADVVNLKELTELAYNRMISNALCYSPLISPSRRILLPEEIAACMRKIGV